MLKVQAKTLSLLYNAKEDRMILLVNKDDVDRTTYWITRRFYFSLLFEFDTYLDNLGIVDKTPVSYALSSSKKVSVSKNTDTKNTISNKKNQTKDLLEPHALLENVNFGLTRDKQRFRLLFKAEKALSETVMTQNDFLGFYDLMKKSFPKGEWGII